MVFFFVIFVEILGDYYIELVGYVAFWVVEELVGDCLLLCFSEGDYGE